MCAIRADRRQRLERPFSLVGSWPTQPRVIHRIGGGWCVSSSWKSLSVLTIAVTMENDAGFRLFGSSADAKTAIFKMSIGGASFTKTRPAGKDAKNHFGLRTVVPPVILAKLAYTVNAGRRSRSMICSSRVDWVHVARSGPG